MQLGGHGELWDRSQSWAREGQHRDSENWCYSETCSYLLYMSIPKQLEKGTKKNKEEEEGRKGNCFSVSGHSLTQ